MRFSKLFAAGLMLVTGFIHATWALAGELADKVAYPDGVIKLFENPDGGGDSCSIAFKTGKYEMSSTGNCKNDQYTYFQLDNVPSATRFKLYSEGDCNKHPDWSYTMRTIVQPTTTAIISILDVSNSAEGSIVSRGVRLDKSYFHHGEIKGKLSCVMVCRSGDTCNWPQW